MNSVPSLDALPSTPAPSPTGRDAAPVAAASRVTPIADALQESLRRGPSARLAATHGEPTASLDLSPAARVLQAALALPAAADARVASMGVPLVALVPPPPAAMAEALAEAIATSGVFYESHLARWARGALARSALAKEPQAAWSTAGAREGEPSPTAPQAPDAAALPLLQRQLDVLDTRTITWNGAAWPGQDVALTIADESAHRGRDQADDGRSPPARWTARLTLTLPELGPLEATLSLEGNAVELVVDSARDDAASRLHDARDALAQGLAVRSLSLSRFAVEAGHAG